MYLDFYDQSICHGIIAWVTEDDSSVLCLWTNYLES